MVDGKGVLAEDSLFTSRFSQSVEIPGRATALRFTVSTNFVDDPSNIPDAFEFALLNAQTGMPVFATAGIENTDAAVNIQSDGRTFIASAVAVDGLATSGDPLDLSQTHTFVVDLTGLSEDVVATLYFDLLGFGTTESSVVIDNVVLDGLPQRPSLSGQLDPNDDTGVVGDGITFRQSVDLIGLTDPGLTVLLDVDGDGFDDGSVVAQQDGSFRFPSVSLDEGVNSPRIQATNAQGNTVVEIPIRLDTSAPTAVLNVPLPTRIRNDDLGYVEVTWSDVGSGVDVSTVDPSDVSITGVTVDRVEFVGDRVRYWYSDGPESLPEGIVDVTVAAAAVGDIAGNPNDSLTQSFTVDRIGPTGTLIAPAPGSTTNSDLGYVDIQWADVGAAGVDLDTLGADDILISGVTVESAAHLGNGIVRYTYDIDGSDSLAAGPVTVTSSAGAIVDGVGNPSDALAEQFTFAPISVGPEDVTDLVAFDFYGRQYNRRTGVYGMYAAITNISNETLQYPIQLRITELGPVGTTILNAHGTLDDGTPYFQIEGTGSLLPGETSGAVVIAIRPPFRQQYSFVPTAYGVVTGSGSEGEFLPEFAAAFSTLAAPIELEAPRRLPMPSFQNAKERHDVNDDGNVTARDALNAINHLSRSTNLIAPDIAAATDLTASLWVDVNGDGNLTALDVLHVINDLRRQSNAASIALAQGEKVDDADEKDQVVDQVYSDLGRSKTEPLLSDDAARAANLVGGNHHSDAGVDDASKEESEDRAESVEYALKTQSTWLD